jgi:hypothetical protein
VLAEHVHRSWARVLGADPVHDHRRVWWKRTGVVRDEQRSARARHVLDVLELDTEPVPVIEVEERLGEAEGRLRPAPIVDLASRLVRGNESAERARIGLGLGLPTRLREVEDVGSRVEALIGAARAPDQGALRAQPAPTLERAA